MNDVDTERHGSLDPKAQSGETLEAQELTSVEAMDIGSGSADVDGKRKSKLQRNLAMSLRYMILELLDGKNDGMNGNDGSSMLYAENENFVFWSGSSTMLDAPPTELKLKILESLAAIDIAKMERVSSEMECLSSNNDLGSRN
ncbi:hypothetical protein OIU77_008362 [Salix suchowensis]|uniref:F-box domain-containing protein n=1 Tax=Salix suchowensis TaxID=1278906 RepID=A0ABQ9AJ63_9ROSI|nr:hypothetical protein OIU77_008362 [Salix suchowensis]